MTRLIRWVLVLALISGMLASCKDGEESPPPEASPAPTAPAEAETAPAILDETAAETTSDAIPSPPEADNPDESQPSRIPAQISAFFQGNHDGLPLNYLNPDEGTADVAADAQSVAPWRVTASTQEARPPMNQRGFGGPENLLDNDPATAWLALGQMNQWVEFRVPLGWRSTAWQIGLRNGCGGDKAYATFARVSKARIVLYDAGGEVLRRTDVNYSDIPSRQDVTLNEVSQVAAIRMEILEVFAPSIAESPVCLSDISFQAGGISAEAAQSLATRQPATYAQTLRAQRDARYTMMTSNPLSLVPSTFRIVTAAAPADSTSLRAWSRALKWEVPLTSALESALALVQDPTAPLSENLAAIIPVGNFSSSRGDMPSMLPYPLANLQPARLDGVRYQTRSDEAVRPLSLLLRAGQLTSQNAESLLGLSEGSRPTVGEDAIGEGDTPPVTGAVTVPDRAAALIPDTWSAYASTQADGLVLIAESRAAFKEAGYRAAEERFSAYQNGRLLAVRWLPQGLACGLIWDGSTLSRVLCLDEGSRRIIGGM